MKKAKTITIGKNDDPTHSILEGHVGVKTFNQAFRAEGWRGSTILKGELKHEYWIPLRRKASWKPAGAYNAKAVPVTVLEW